MKDYTHDKYSRLGGLQRIFDLYKKGDKTLTQIGKEVGITGTTVSNDIKSRWGVDAIEEARIERRKNIRLAEVNSGKSTEFKYQEALTLKSQGSFINKGNVRFFESIISIARQIVGDPQRVWFSFHSIAKVQGEKGIVRVRYAEPDKTSPEYSIKRYRFKITPSQTNKFEAFLFCLYHHNECSFYLIPSTKLKNIKSLNLKFTEHEKTHKYGQFLAKAELLK